jgi:hypothetical protein
VQDVVDARLPFAWLHAGGRLPDPYPSVPGYNRRELILDVWANGSATLEATEQLRAVLKALAFLEAWTVPGQGDAAALVYTFSAEAEPQREAASIHGHKRFAVSYLDRALVM